MSRDLTDAQGTVLDPLISQAEAPQRRPWPTLARLIIFQKGGEAKLHEGDTVEAEPRRDTLWKSVSGSH